MARGFLTLVVLLVAVLTGGPARAQILAHGDLSESEFLGELARAKRTNQSWHWTSQERPLVHVALRDGGAGELVYLSSMDPAKATDDDLNRDDLKYLYPTFKRLSSLGFRVTVDFAATQQTLRYVLRSKTPTILIWNSHGAPDHLVDSQSAVVRPENFKDVSPAVYQLIISSCYGSLSWEKTYKKVTNASFMLWAWPRKTTSSDLAFFNGDEWSPLINYPGEFKVNGIACRQAADKKYQMFTGEKALGVPSWTSRDDCLMRASQAGESFACAPSSEATWSLYGLPGGGELGMWGGAGRDLCYGLPMRSVNGKLCLISFSAEQKKSKFFIADSAKGIDIGRSFDDYESCQKEISSSVDL